MWRNPQNEGKVFLFRYGKKIFDMVSSMANPEFEDETQVDVFNLWDGANFKLKIRKLDGYSNYDKSEFITAAPLSDDDDKMETIWKSQHSLDEFTDEKNFKSFDELKSRLDTVLGNVPSPAMSAPSSVEESSAPFDGGRPITSTPSSSTGETSSDDNLDYFKKLAEA
jgi:hypothetical protein